MFVFVDGVDSIFDVSAVMILLTWSLNTLPYLLTTNISTCA